jgi:anti-anti-sigma factor
MSLFSGGIFELVRGRETDLMERVLPLVRRQDVALDMAGVERVDAAGLAALISLYCEAAKCGRVFVLEQPSRHVREVLSVVGLDRILVADGACQRSFEPRPEEVAA